MDEKIKSVEDKWDKLYSSFKGFSDGINSIILVERIAGELLLDTTLLGKSIKDGIAQNKPCALIIKTCAEMINDGWKGLSINLSNDLKKFYDETTN